VKTNDLSVIIAASGLGTRLYSESLEVCKPLFFYKTKPIIAHLIDAYREASNDIIITISNDTKGNFLKAWLLDYYSDPEWLNFYVQNIQNGTNFLIGECLNLCANNRVLVSWSDFILNDNILPLLGEEAIFFTGNIECRFSELDGKIVKNKNNPGFIGLYYFPYKPRITEKLEDFIENFLNENVKTENINIINLGTIEDLIVNKSFDKVSSRFFNRVEFKDTIVIKTALNEHAKKLQKLEVNWYDFQLKNKNLSMHLAQHSYSGTDALTLQKLEAVPVAGKTLGKDFWREKLPALLTKLHSENFDVNSEDVMEVYVEKPAIRLAKVQRIIDAWFEGSIIINDEMYDKNLLDIPSDIVPNYFSTIHGDINFNNLLVDNVGELKLIDPRGYFGKSEIFGDPAYDIAKILYAYDGYDRINQNKFLLSTSSKGTFLYYNSASILDPNAQYFFSWAMDSYGISKEKLNFLLYGIWLSLGAYIIDSPLAIIASYCQAQIRSRHFLIQ
jgi:thiamine kinase-like enzyme